MLIYLTKYYFIYKNALILIFLFISIHMKMRIYLNYLKIGTVSIYNLNDFNNFSEEYLGNS